MFDKRVVFTGDALQYWKCGQILDELKKIIFVKCVSRRHFQFDLGVGYDQISRQVWSHGHRFEIGVVQGYAASSDGAFSVIIYLRQSSALLLFVSGSVGFDSDDFFSLC